MDTLKTILVAAAVALVILVGQHFVPKAEAPDSLGGYVPGVAMGPLNVTTFTQGGGITATTSSTSVTLLATAIDTENIVEVTADNGVTTLTLPASSTMTGFAPYPGDMRTIWIRSASTSASSGVIVAAGTGMTFKNAASSTVLLVGDTDGDNTMRLDFIRKSDTDFNVYLMKYQD